MLLLAALLALTFPAQDPAAPPDVARSPLDRSVTLVLARDEQGSSAVHAVADDFTGSLHAWFRAQDPAGLVMEVVEPAGAIHRACPWTERGPLPRASLVVQPGVHWTLRLRGPAEAVGRSVELRLFQELDDPEARAALARGQELLAEARGRLEAGERAAGEGLLEEGIEAAFRALRVKGLLELLALGWSCGLVAQEFGATHIALAAFERALDHVIECFPGDDPLVQQARNGVAGELLSLGQTERALELRRAVLAFAERRHEPGARQITRARSGLAATLLHANDPSAALELAAELVRELEPRAAEDDPDLLWMREVQSLALRQLGDLAEAERVDALIVDVRRRSPRSAAEDLWRARANLASTRLLRGDAAGAAAELEEVLRAAVERLPDDSPDVLSVRQNLAAARRALGDLIGARALEEAVLAARERSRPEGDPDLQVARLALARTLKQLGDPAAARVLEERVVAIEELLYPDDHPDLRTSRNNLSVTLASLGERDEARRLRAQVHAATESRFPPDHPERLELRASLALDAWEVGDFETAHAELAAVLVDFERALGPHHERVVQARHDLALTAHRLGRHDQAEDLAQAVLAARMRALPPAHPRVQRAREILAYAIAARAHAAEAASDQATRAQAAQRVRALVREMAQQALETARAAILTGAMREAEERCARLAGDLETLLVFAQGAGGFEPDPALLADAFALCETTRAAGLAAAELASSTARDEDYARLRAELREASAVLAGLAQAGAPEQQMHAARGRRERAERALAARGAEAGGAHPMVDAQALAARLPRDAVAIGYRRLRTTSDPLAPAVDALGAFVLRRATDGAPDLAHVDLGPLAQIEAAVRAWRSAIGAGVERGLATTASGEDEREAGVALRRLVWDPLEPLLSDARRAIVAVDDVLHLVPLDALPLDAPDHGTGELLGARWSIELRVALRELLRPAPAVSAAGALVTLGGAAFNSEPVPLDAADAEVLGRDEPESDDARTRGSAAPAWPRAFAPLTYTGLEAREVAALFAEVFGEERGALALEKRSASREALLAAAPRARYLHVATHGWYAPESVRAWSDGELGERRFAAPSGTESVVRGMSPMLLAGLALCGANRPPDATGRVPGIVTAEELSTLDLARCELAVLSACDTNVGERRAGQGVASLQKALHMAGAQSVVTSLWKVPDEATRELMLDFYRRLWVEGQTKAAALWGAKMRLREARDETGARIHATRDWAAWVLSGERD
ncbi:MAG: CHAT domain-containing protein [Planctomycetes bacterium]|nr:CHAT domain-containing protein [Planctomycetota bacterium]